MAAYTEVRFEGTPEEVNAAWVEARKGGIGGSDLSAIMGINKYTTPLDVWLVKTGRADSPDLSGKEAVEWGNRLEDTVAAKFAENHQELKVKRRNAMLVSKERPWAFANLDRTVRDADGRMGVLEIKTCGSRRASDWDDGVPAYYLAQVTHYLGITGWGYAWVAVLIGGQEYREYYVPRDEEDIAAAIGAADGFWHGFVETDTPPALVGAPSEGGSLAAWHGDPSAEFGFENDADVPEIDEIESLKWRISELQARKAELENSLKMRIGDSKGIETQTRRITWVRSKRASFDKRRFDADHPGETEPYTTVATRDGGLRVTEKERTM